MKISSRWIVRDDGSTPATAVAARTIRKRLTAVWSSLPRACEPGGDPEQVHQLRVASRRALAALDAFDTLLPEKRMAWFKKHLRRLRRAAGEARDLDVLTARLRRDLDAPQRAVPRPSTSLIPGRAARARLVAMLSRQRPSSRQPIRDRYERLLEADWPGRMERLLERLAKRPSQASFDVYARRRLPRLVGRFFEKADRTMHDAAALHAFRIEGKKLRYALEIFASVLPPRPRANCYHALEQLQETLGDFTDHASAADRFRRWSLDAAATAHRDAIDRLRRKEEQRAKRARKDFSAWWDNDRRASLLRTFDRTLRRRPA
ncbi:MAG: CHAD domain-containing protein [Planctomycetia bacterium]